MPTLAPQLASLIGLLRQRLPFPVSKAVLNKAGFPIGRSWESILEKLADPTTPNGHMASLEDGTKEALSACDKLISIYPIASNNLWPAHQILSRLKQAGFSNSYSSNYPLPLPPSSLLGLPVNDINPVDVIETPTGSVLVCVSHRLLERREHLVDSQLDPILVGRYSDVFGVRKEHFQAFNAIYVPNFGDYIAILSDLSASERFNTQSAAIDHISLRNYFNSAFGSVILSTPRNLFSAIKSLYLSPEGEVSQLSHTVAQGIKHERMRGSRCVRQEMFHQGGARAVSGNLDPYQIRLKWDFTQAPGLVGRPNLGLLGDYKMTYQASPVLSEAELGDCATYSEVDHLINLLIRYS